MRSTANIKLALYNMLILSFALSFVYFTKKYFAVPGNYVTIFVLVVAGAYIWLNRNHIRQKPLGFKFLYSFIPAFLLCLWFAFVGVFGKFDIAAIIFHLQMGAGGDFPPSLYKPVLRYVGSFVLFVCSFAILINLDMRFLRLDRILCVLLLLINPIFWNIGHYWLSDGVPDERLISAYQEPGRLFQAENKPKNLIILYAESMERSLGKITHSERSFEEMNRLAAQGLEFIGVRQVQNTGWSMAGVVTSQCGIPLQPLGIFSGNMFDSQKDFFAGIDCISDILHRNGYYTAFMDGGDHKFAGMAPFLKTHQYSEASGWAEYAAIAGDYRNGWGLFDDTLLSLASDRVRELAAKQQPYLLSIATIGAHFPTGNPTQSCEEANIRQSLPAILYAVKCSGYEIERFVTTLQQESLLENTLLVIVSDHLMMKNEFDDELNAQDRMNYMVVLGDGIEPAQVTRDGAMFDVLPTMLDLLGFDLQDGRAGLGVSLLSANKTLAERHGYDQLNMFIGNDMLLAEKAWFDERIPIAVAAQ